MFELINPSDIHLNLRVYEKDIKNLAIGQKVLAYTNANPDKKYMCTIILISKDIDASGTTDIHCHFQKYDPTLLPGMYMNAEVEIAATTAPALPEECIVLFENKYYVFVAANNKKYEMVEVHLGSKENGYYIIENSDALNSKNIVGQGAYTLLMKLKNTEVE
jgi:membrane fusion protein, heavy metal efflux system